MQQAMFQRHQHLWQRYAKMLVVGQIPADFAPDCAAQLCFWGDTYQPDSSPAPAFRPPLLDGIDAVVILLPKSRALLARLLAELAADYAGKACFLLGAKAEGIQGGARQFAAFVNGGQKIDSARHCQLWQGVLPQKDYQIDDFIEYFDYQCQQIKLQLTSLAGVFNHGSLDAGTAFLLATLQQYPLPIAQKALDFGAGCGVLGVYLKTVQGDCAVDLLDNSRAAIYSSQKSALGNQVAINTIWADKISDLSGGYDVIVANPPFHQGVAVDYQISAQFFKDALVQLNLGGSLTIVANGFLPYPALLTQIFGNCQELARNSQFKVLRAVKNGASKNRV